MTPPRHAAVLAHQAPAPRPPRKALWSDEGLDDVERLMLELCSGERLDRLGAILWEHVNTGGKRLRARLALASCQALGGTREQAVAWAAACELLHNATLIHDDLQDGDEVRRGREALWVRHGAAQAINAGDLALMLPYRTTASAWRAIARDSCHLVASSHGPRAMAR